MRMMVDRFLNKPRTVESLIMGAFYVGLMAGAVLGVIGGLVSRWLEH